MGIILLLAIVSGVGGTNLPHYGGKTANPPWLYSWARPLTVMVSQPCLLLDQPTPSRPLSEVGFHSSHLAT